MLTNKPTWMTYQWYYYSPNTQFLRSSANEVAPVDRTHTLFAYTATRMVMGRSGSELRSEPKPLRASPAFFKSSFPRFLQELRSEEKTIPVGQWSRIEAWSVDTLRHRNAETGNQRRNVGRNERKKAKEERRRRDPIVFDHFEEPERRCRERLVGNRVQAFPKVPRSLWLTSTNMVPPLHHQSYFPERRRGLFDYGEFSQAHFLELGNWTCRTRTGPFVRKYTATDIPALVTLLRKNILSVPAPAPASATVTVLNRTLPMLLQVDVRRADVPDRVFHPILHTSAVVVAELRAEDVLREFLQG
ncbi:hypothetical protein EDB92DRAFT_1818109 [Lactarius akahatsu]|uniref:Uncharacterized protein n=1 Tax=Lactarius akahatsu TaxID=416441 RepID=A0AAD4LBI5_9AGAM|nr:hypothetical protein EDB92DRAFT_1818109 [Lactarius akahatsu]